MHPIFPDDPEHAQELQLPFVKSDVATLRIGFGNCCYSKHQYELLSILGAVLLGKYEFKADEYGKVTNCSSLFLQTSTTHFSRQTGRLVHQFVTGEGYSTVLNSTLGKQAGSREHTTTISGSCCLCASVRYNFYDP